MAGANSRVSTLTAYLPVIAVPRRRAPGPNRTSGPSVNVYLRRPMINSSTRGLPTRRQQSGRACSPAPLIPSITPSGCSQISTAICASTPDLGLRSERAQRSWHDATGCVPVGEETGGRARASSYSLRRPLFESNLPDHDQRHSDRAKRQRGQGEPFLLLEQCLSQPRSDQDGCPGALRSV